MSTTPEKMVEYSDLPVRQRVRGMKGQMLKTGHCNICEAVLAISVDGTPFDADDPNLVLHRQWHEILFASIEEAAKTP